MNSAPQPMVVIDLGVDENAQEIFETLNARGAQLTAADLIKNFIFQRLLEADTDVEKAYQEHWKEFETGFWETEISVGRLRYPRSSIFLNHWLIARTGEEVVAREVFSRFKRFADHDSGLTMTELLEQVHSAAGVYESFVRSSSETSGSIDRLGLFGYRTSVLESEVIKPLVMYLRDPEQPPVPQEQLEKALDAVESWLVRRMLVRATTKSYTAVIAEMIRQLRRADRNLAGDVVEKYLAGLTTESGYWPDDEEVRGDMESLLAYKRLRRGRLRMVLEAIEDHLRGWKDGKAGMGGQRAARDAYAIEHIMPRRWGQHWPLDETIDAAGRDRIVDTIGNLTLLTSGLNSKVSNGPWLGAGGKRERLQQHDVLVLNRKLLETVGDRWSEEAIRQRTRELTGIIIRIWPVPEGHKSAFAPEKARIRKKIGLDDLISGGVLEPGMRLYPRRKAFSDRVVTLLPDGRIEVDGVACLTPTEAGKLMTRGRINGWWFFLVDPASRRSLRDVRSDYINEMAVDAEEDEDDEDDE